MLEVAIALIFTAVVPGLGMFVIKLLDHLTPRTAYALTLLTIPPAIAVGLGYLVTRRPRASAVQLTTYTLLLLPLLLAVAFVVGVIKEGVQF